MRVYACMQHARRNASTRSARARARTYTHARTHTHIHTHAHTHTHTRTRTRASLCMRVSWVWGQRLSGVIESCLQGAALRCSSRALPPGEGNHNAI